MIVLATTSTKSKYFFTVYSLVVCAGKISFRYSANKYVGALIPSRQLHVQRN